MQVGDKTVLFYKQTQLERHNGPLELLERRNSLDQTDPKTTPKVQRTNTQKQGVNSNVPNHVLLHQNTQRSVLRKSIG